MSLLRGIVRLSGPRAPLRTGPSLSLNPRAPLTSKVSALEIGTGETVIGLGVMSAVILIPAAWFLAHIEKYKKRE
ncbi:cytochrome c oxidase subunit 8A, mitochondrial-like [Mustelus asterias]